ncbi:MAG TPA: VWA domain-containing protein [Candidatus Acidoferrales bacterium]|nr:VWA domain-containing protein [Candidatus Acidoferrales bacterium]
MKTRLLAFIDVLRGAGLSITVAETLDAMQAVGVLGVGREALLEGLAAAVVKDEADRPTFEAVFDRFFAVPVRPRGKGKHPRPSDDGNGHGAGQAGGLSHKQREAEPHRQEPSRRSESAHRERERAHGRERTRERPDRSGQRLARQRALQAVPFCEMTAADVEACAELVAELAQRFRAHLSRRQRHAARGRLDLRRTLRRSISKGGVPIEPAFRERRPGRPDLVALTDSSHSVATASNFLLALLAPAPAFCRRVRLFAFVDQPVEVSLESGRVMLHESLDLYARSDFGHVLVTFWQQYEPLLTRNTILLILGDARNNRRPPRADILARMHAAVRRVVWLNPEPPQRWNSGDSVMHLYRRHCDTLLAASNLRELSTALRQTFRVS